MSEKKILNETKNHTSLYIVVEDAYEAAIKLNTDTEKIYEWSTRWLVNFNPKKSKAMTISIKSNKPHHPPVYMNGTIIKEVDSHKQFGLFFHEDGNMSIILLIKLLLG
jgi:hypothetical protein